MTGWLCIEGSNQNHIHEKDTFAFIKHHDNMLYESFGPPLDDTSWSYSASKPAEKATIKTKMLNLSIYVIC